MLNNYKEMFKGVICLFAAFSSIGMSAQIPDYKMTSTDEEFTIEVVREEKTVSVIIQFPHPENYHHVLVERLMGEPSQFRQCAYLDQKMLTTSENGAISVVDLHPSKTVDDSFYRLRTISIENIERVYPSLRLPSGKGVKTVSLN
ncbi:MAG: hypothetical protein IPP77_03890 [Bacteroidetes bacterium]|nr:hypothetical protein [Bacteroidota bacterium]